MEGLVWSKPMADEPRREEAPPPAKPRDDDSASDAREGTRGKDAKSIPEDVVDDDRFQATDN
jgi:hypothetical protein